MRQKWRLLGALAVATLLVASVAMFANAPNTANTSQQSNGLLASLSGNEGIAVTLDSGVLEGGALVGSTLATENDVTVINISPNNTTVANDAITGALQKWGAINNTLKTYCTATKANTPPPALAMNGNTAARNGPMAKVAVNMNNSFGMPNSTRSTEGGNRYGAELATSATTTRINANYRT